ncbi:MAG: hypothetical protein JO267_13095 [Alphaproteobacteria bacterium]|nr:hypothetical protein [Alphaproteobacteria bacterium]
MRRISALSVAMLAAMLLKPGPAAATQQGQITLQHWKTMDVCARQAQAAFPDYTPEANAKRDAKLKECLAGNNLPPREPLSPAAGPPGR